MKNKHGKGLTNGEKANFETLTSAFKNGDVCIMQCTRVRDGKLVPIVCAMGFNPKTNEYCMTPFAELLGTDGNPFDEYEPPMGAEDTQEDSYDGYQCGSCEQLFDEPTQEDNECPHCGSGNYVKGYIDDDTEDNNA